MKILITGGTGSVGRETTRRLVAAGHDVLVVGRRPEMAVPGAQYAACDVTQFTDLREKMAGREAVVHLAAIANPTAAPGPEVIRVNVLGTFNVFEAAAQAGVRRVVQASSINAFGCHWGLVDLDHVRYFPVDEEHPVYTTDPYSFSKEVIEGIGHYYWRRDGITSLALRLPGVHPQDYLAGDKYRQNVRQGRAVLDEVAGLPAAQRLERLAAARRRNLEYRRQRPTEHGAQERGAPSHDFSDDPFCRMYIGSRSNFWAFVDERDSAQAVEKGLLAKYEGSHVLFVNDSHNWLLYDTEKLLGLFFPEVTPRRRPIRGSESLISIDQARALIGFEPEYSVAQEERKGEIKNTSHN